MRCVADDVLLTAVLRCKLHDQVTTYDVLPAKDFPRRATYEDPHNMHRALQLDHEYETVGPAT